MKEKENKRLPLQLPFEVETEGLREVWFFHEGTVIWPERSGRGVVQGGLYAKELPEGRKIKGLTGFSALEPVTLYLDRRYWTLPKGSLFGAYKGNGERVKIKRK
ncbi:MAG: hypothetical protein ACPLXP_03570 [Microgenomates group bacterium]